MKTFQIAGLILASSLMASCTADLAAVVKNQFGKPDPSASPGASANISANVTLPNPLEIATATGFTSESCSQEGKVKSSNGPATQVTFKNSSQGKIKIFWLDNTGKRIEYNKNGQQASGNGGLDAGASYTQQTFVTHPWLIANEQGECQGIYTPNSSTASSLDIKKTVIVGSGSTTGTGSASGSASGNVAASGATEARVRQGIDCLKAKGNTTQATSVQGLLNLYLNFKNLIGVEAAAKGYLDPALPTLSKEGC